MHVIVTFKDRAFADYAKRLGALATEGRALMAEALNVAGATARKATVAAETTQTALKQDTIDRAQAEITATPERLAFTITSRGGNVRAKFFNAHESGGGVVADPWGRSTTYAGAFIMGGRPGARVPLGFGGEVKVRAGRGRLPLRTVRSGLFIPKEMTSGATVAAFDAALAPAAEAVVSRLGSLLP